MRTARLVGLAAALQAACGGQALRGAGRDAGHDGTGAGSGGVNGDAGPDGGDVAPGFPTIKLDSAPRVADLGDVRADGDGAAETGRAPGDAQDLLDAACDFNSLWRSVVNAAAVIGYCDPVAVCSWDVDAGTPVLISSLHSCVAWAAPDVGIAVINGVAYIGDGGGRYLNDFVYFDGDGRLVHITMAYASTEQELLDAWAACRWPYFAGKVIGAYCYSE
jgi:hypothetical protein